MVGFVGWLIESKSALTRSDAGSPQDVGSRKYAGYDWSIKGSFPQVSRDMTAFSSSF